MTDADGISFLAIDLMAKIANQQQIINLHHELQGLDIQPIQIQQFQLNGFFLIG